MYLKHLSIVSFKPKAIRKFCQLPVSDLEKIESIELLRAIENQMKVGTFKLKGDSFQLILRKIFKKQKDR